MKNINHPFMVLVVVLTMTAALSFTFFGCAPLPPLEDENAQLNEEKPDQPAMSEQERMNMINMHRSFAHEYWKQGNYEQAIAYFDTIYVYDYERKHNIYRSWADCYNKLQMPDSAIFAYEEGIKYFGDDAYLHESLAYMYRNRGKFDEAIEQYNEALRIQEGDVEILVQLVELYKRIEDWENAIATAHVLTEIAPDNQEYHDNLSNMIRTYRDPEEFIQALRDGIEKFPEDYDRRLTLANALFEQGLNEKAAAEFKVYTDAKPDNVSGWQGYAKTLDNLNRLPQAIVAYKKLDQLQPDMVDNKIAIGNIYLLQKNWQQARRWALKALGVKSGYGPAYVLMGDVYQGIADEVSGDSPTYNDKLVFVIAYGLYKKAAESKHPQARSDGDRGIRILTGSYLVPSTEDRFMHLKEIRPKGKAYSWISLDWPEVKYIDTFLENLK